jgi:hypothetical protein
MLTITQLDVSALTVRTDLPEADGTIEWDSTTIRMGLAAANKLLKPGGRNSYHIAEILEMPSKWASKTTELRPRDHLRPHSNVCECHWFQPRSGGIT